MNQYGWPNCPAPVRRAVEDVVGGFECILGSNLLGIYLHGSLAMDCFNPDRSDIDLLVVTHKGMDVAAKRQVAELLLRHSNAPRPIEISFVHRAQLHPWQYPTPFDFHYSEDWREQTTDALADGSWNLWNNAERRDADLAAHLTITLARGIPLCGPAPRDVFPPVPPADYLDAIWGDIAESPRWIGDQPVYGVLNLCRVYAYVRDGLVCSKDEGATWALNATPVEQRVLIAQALRAYRGEQDEATIDRKQVTAFARDMLKTIKRYRR
jgi:predicted nucleotidyltransferase